MRPLFHTLLLALSIALVALAGCKKTDALASINGTWTSDSYHERTIAGNTLILDTTYSVTPVTMTFAGDSISTSSGIKGLYTLNGNTLLITYEANSNSPYTPIRLNILFRH